MDDKDKMRFAGGETDELPPAPDNSGLSKSDAVQKDMTYSPGSETETRQKQEERVPENVDDDIDTDDVRVAPGTGGPDDVGDIEVDPDELNLPGRS